MRKLILQMQMSADGYMSADTDIDWQLWGWGGRWNWDERLKKDFNAVSETVGCILLSRKMAEEGYLNHWAQVAREHSDERQYLFAQKIGQVEKVVLTNKLQASPWERTSLARGELIEEINVLKSQGSGDIIAFGGISFASALVNAGVVDEYQLYVNPTAVGAGLSIFDPTAEVLQLYQRQSMSYECGMVVERYTKR